MPSAARQTAQRREGQGAAEPGAAPDPAERSSPDWLLHVLTVSGPAGAVARFRAAARGTGGVPWHFDLDHEAARLLAPMAAAGAEARMLVQHIRDVQAARHDRVLARWAERGSCPLDLHRLIPIPGHILALGEDDPAAQKWMRTHWGTTRMLRAVRIKADNADRRLRRKAEIVVEFRSADWTPWQAVIRLRRDWPKLVITVQPRYDDV
jgi:hypothetical protein